MVHIGAHEAEEFESYQKMGWGNELTLWIDALEEKAEIVRTKIASYPHHRMLTVLLGESNLDEVNFHEANNGQSSSVLNLGTHAVSYPEIQFTKTHGLQMKRFDNLVESFPNGKVLVNLDVQGLELPVLKGFGTLIDKVDWIYTEVNTEEVYENCTIFADLDTYLREHDFTCVDVRSTRHGWGDAFFVKSSMRPSMVRPRKLLSKLIAKPNKAKELLARLIKN